MNNFRLSRRRFFPQLGALAATLASSPARSQQTTLNIGYTPAADFLPLYVANEMGYFEKRNLNVTLTRMPIAAEIPSALVARSLQLGVGTGPMLLEAAESGLDLMAVGGVSRFVKTNSTVSLVGRAGLALADPSELRGKKVGVPGLNGMLHLLFQKWLLDRSVPPGEVTMVEVAAPEIRELLKSGALDAAIAVEPFRGRVLADQTGFHIADFATEVQDDLLAAVWMAKSDWIKVNRPTLRAFHEAYAEAITYCMRHPLEAREFETAFLGMPSVVVPLYSMDVKPADLELFARIGRELGLLRAPVDVQKLIWK